MKRLEVSRSNGPWSWRAFPNGDDADRFHRRLTTDQPPPFELAEPHVAPDGSVLRTGSWIVLYRPIIFD
jgi:hypothetical protein